MSHLSRNFTRFLSYASISLGMNSKTTTIAIIGGGATALYLLKAFVQRNEPNLQLSIFERGEAFGAGMPYSPEWNNTEHELNIASKELPELAIEPHDWLREQDAALKQTYGLKDSDINEDIVLPRILFGKYLESLFKHYLSEAKAKKLSVKLYPSENILNVAKENHSFKVVSTNAQYDFDYVIVATGHSWPLADESHYLASPYPLRKLKLISNQRIGILGSSLTAIDAIRTVAREHGEFLTTTSGLKFRQNTNTPNFKITMHSRKGLLPNIRYHLEHPRIRKYEYISKEDIMRNIEQNNGFLSLDYVYKTSYLDTLKLKDPQTYQEIKDLSIEEFCAYYFAREGVKDFSTYETKLALMKETEKLRTPLYWKEAMEDTIYTLNFHAKNLSAKDMLRLRNYIMPIYNHVVMFVPYRSVEELIALYRAGVLENMELGFNADLLNGEISYQGTVLRYDLLINCIGQANMNIEDFPFKDLVRTKVVTQAKIPADNLALSDLPQGCMLKDNYLYLPGLAIDDAFQAVNDEAEESKLYLVSIPFIRGFNPDLSGLPLLNDVAKMVMGNIQA